MRTYRIATACKGATMAIPAIANIPATPNAWPPRAVLSPIAGSIPTTRSPASGAATIDPDTESAISSTGSVIAAAPARAARTSATCWRTAARRCSVRSPGNSRPPRFRRHARQAARARLACPGCPWRRAPIGARQRARVIFHRAPFRAVESDHIQREIARLWIEQAAGAALCRTGRGDADGRAGVRQA
jgi:hypothetical protein